MDIAITLIFLLLVLVFSTVLHELAHGYMAYWLGDETAKLSGRLSLNPLRHIDPYMSIVLPVLLYLMGGPIFGGAKPVPINTRNLKGGEWGFALVAIAGPLTNFILAFIFFLLWFTIGHNNDLWSGILINSMYMNMGFALFNMIPIPPLDGSRVLYALAPDFVKRFMESIEHVGIIFVYIMISFLSSLIANYMNTAQSAILKLFLWIVGAS
ncbi:MAG: site-2 protease family protein [Candidatus Saccharibacteria bacterium]|nr:site-2 protease family protein [Candidatus Saccharibacteria bacterium]